MAAYTSSKRLGYLPQPSLSELSKYEAGSLAFDSAVSNESVQKWLVDQFSKRALAEKRGQPAEVYERTVEDISNALTAILGEEARLDVGLEPDLHPILLMRGRRLNLSQLPDGVLTTLGWLADFIRRQQKAGCRDGILMIDEIDAHLHPRWQRQILPTLQAALPKVQIIVTSHSPFVISSCRGARVHLLEIGRDGKAMARPPIDAPFGQSVQATIKGIFGVDTLFDADTETKLEDWNELKRQEAAGKLPAPDRKRLHDLAKELSGRSEELRFIVGLPPKLSSSMLRAVIGTNQAGKVRKTSRRSVR